ncbi:hypothetical protein [Mycobacterium innocens]|uniref:hypothetical protein n=1 Tax=Mycobacterium innocens TaxID=2341083 RepID=UPI0010A95A80|nr:MULTISPECIES: hypothetical protein [Mycobacterium]
MTATDAPCASGMTDRSLHLIINAIESNPHSPGADVDVTLHLPWGTVTGVIEPCWYFDQKVLGYLQTVGVDHSRQSSTDGNCPNCPNGGEFHEYIHLSRVRYRRSGAEVYSHDQLRVRLSDISSWAFGRSEF